MSSTPVQVFSSSNETKDYLNIARSNTDSDPKIQTARNAADNYNVTQTKLHASFPLTDPDPELTSLTSQLAAAFFNQFQNPRKTEMIEATKMAKEGVQDHIMATYGRKNPGGLSGADTFGVTSAITGRTR